MGESGENSDGWIAGWRRLMERNQIGWCFWPYKKPEAGTCLVTFDLPAGYSLIRVFADTTRSTFERIRTLRPDPARVREALREYLARCRVEQCRVNEGYREALGLGKRASPAK